MWLLPQEVVRQWNSLDKVIKSLKDVNIISLTATHHMIVTMELGRSMLDYVVT